jgi:hypothetical protein
MTQTAGQLSSQPWWQFPRIDHFGSIDPAGNFYKPDSNIQIPGYYPIAALLPGTVTSVQNTGFGQTVVTVRLDNPLNDLATHTFYEHMSSATVGVGSHLSAGDLLGYNNPPGQVPLGVGLYSGDIYGSGTAWDILQQDLAPGGAGLLNPVALLDAASQGKLNIPTGTYVGHPVSSVAQANSTVPIIGPLLDWLNQFKPVIDWLTNPMRLFKITVGVGLLLVAVVMLLAPSYEEAITKAFKVAVKTGVFEA